MTAAAFSPAMKPNKTALTAVILLHGAALAALVLVKGTDIIPNPFKPTVVIQVPLDKPPDPKPLPKPQIQLPPVPQIIDRPPPVIDLPPRPSFESDSGPTTPVQQSFTSGPGDIVAPPSSAIQPAEPKKVEPARARANLGSYVSDADYPAEAIRREEQGVTRFRLTVSPDGRVADCSVTGSSGSSALDAATCRLMKSRARFSPARDSDGKPTTDTVANAIKWVLPEG
ncbi:MAG: periplasmic protein TonB [Sphingomonadales bacterium]|jgi:protein TonB|nr:periplasmic protein TonB [Sphingomonadales bacterium]MEA3049140.1 periplasmic protein TonB [Sphingomonadales bacterium]